MNGSDTETRIELTDEGFALFHQARKIATVRWVHVAEIAAYRNDPGGNDLLHLAFREGNSRQYVELHEELLGYQDLLERMYDAFPEIRREWWMDIARTYGPNRTTIYGLPASEQSQATPAERYLKQIRQRKKPTRSQWVRFGWAVAAVLAAAGVQTLAAWGLARWSVLLAMTAWPMLLVIVVARRCSRPRVFFLLLTGFHISTWTWELVLDFPGPCLLGQLLRGTFSYLLILGVEILLGMAVMLLPDRKAAGPTFR